MAIKSARPHILEIVDQTDREQKCRGNEDGHDDEEKLALTAATWVRKTWMPQTAMNVRKIETPPARLARRPRVNICRAAC
jgi:hypothetical protein